MSYLGDHGEAQHKKSQTANQSEQRLVFAQVIGELIRNRRHYSFYGGKLERNESVNEKQFSYRLYFIL